MPRHDERTLTEDEKIRAAQSLFSHPDFRVISDLLYELEQDAVRAIRGDLGNPQEHILTIRTVDRFRTSIRALAEQSGILEDPIRKEV